MYIYIYIYTYIYITDKQIYIYIDIYIYTLEVRDNSEWVFLKEYLITRFTLSAERRTCFNPMPLNRKQLFFTNI